MRVQFYQLKWGQMGTVPDMTRVDPRWPLRPWQLYALLALGSAAGVFFIVFGLISKDETGLAGTGVALLLFVSFWTIRFRPVLPGRAGYRSGGPEGGRDGHSGA